MLCSGVGQAAAPGDIELRCPARPKGGLWTAAASLAILCNVTNGLTVQLTWSLPFWHTFKPGIAELGTPDIHQL